MYWNKELNQEMIQTSPLRRLLDRQNLTSDYPCQNSVKLGIVFSIMKLKNVALFKAEIRLFRLMLRYRKIPGNRDKNHVRLTHHSVTSQLMGVFSFVLAKTEEIIHCIPFRNYPESICFTNQNDFLSLYFQDCYRSPHTFEQPRENLGQ